MTVTFADAARFIANSATDADLNAFGRARNDRLASLREERMAAIEPGQPVRLDGFERRELNGLTGTVERITRTNLRPHSALVLLDEGSTNTLRLYPERGVPAGAVEFEVTVVLSGVFPVCPEVPAPAGGPHPAGPATAESMVAFVRTGTTVDDLAVLGSLSTQRRAVVRALRGALVRPGCAVVLRDISPKYLSGLRGTVTTLTKGRKGIPLATLTLDEPSSAQLAKAGKGRYEPANVLDGIPLTALDVL